MVAPTASRQRPDQALVYAALVIIAGVLATTLAQTQVLARLPLQNLLKNELDADRTANAAFFFWAGLAWYLKPFAGILTDAFPLFGSRRTSYLLVPVTLLFLQEQRQRSDPRLLLENARSQLVKIATARTMWGAAGLMALFYIAPGFATALFYKQQNELHLGTQAQGFLQLIAGFCGVLAAVGYGILCRRLNLRTLLVGGMIFATAANLGYLFYSSAGRAQVIEGLNGIGYTLAELALMDLAVRATPAGSEGWGFSLVVSVRNLALFGTDWFGSHLLDEYHFSFDSLVIANSLTTLIAVPLVFLLPRLLVIRKDAESYEETPELKAAME